MNSEDKPPRNPEALQVDPHGNIVLANTGERLGVIAR